MCPFLCQADALYDFDVQWVFLKINNRILKGAKVYAEGGKKRKEGRGREGQRNSSSWKIWSFLLHFTSPHQARDGGIHFNKICLEQYPAKEMALTWTFQDGHGWCEVCLGSC